MFPKISTEDVQEMAAAYALGTLTQHEARAVEAHLSEHGSDALANELASFEAVTASLAFAVKEALPPAKLRQELLSKIAEQPQTEASESFHLPAVFSQTAKMFSLRSDEGDWAEIAPGLLTKTLFVDQERATVTSLVKMMPGAALPPHRHRGDEQFYVLEGDCNVHGTCLGPGDFHRAPAGSIHESTFTVEGTTFLLIAPADYEILQPAR